MLTSINKHHPLYQSHKFCFIARHLLPVTWGELGWKVCPSSHSKAMSRDCRKSLVRILLSTFVSKPEESCLPHRCSLGVVPVKAGSVSEVKVTPSSQAPTSLSSHQLPSSDTRLLQIAFLFILP